jgi:histone H3/H4
MSESNVWKRCSSCKKDIELGAKFYVCSVSTCQHPRKGYQFCSVPCWDAHLGYANHKESWAVEKNAPKTVETESASQKKPIDMGVRRKIVEDLPKKKSGTETLNQASDFARIANHSIKTDTLVVVSKVKKLIKDESGFNTSQCCIDALTNKVVLETLKAIENAKKSERKTVMGRDVI